MRMRFDRGDLAKLRAPFVCVPLAEEDSLRDRALGPLNTACGGVLAAVARSSDFAGKLWSQALLYNPRRSGPRRILLLGLGKREQVDHERIRQAAARAAKRAGELGVTEAAIYFPLRGPLAAAAAQALTEGGILGDYRYDPYVTPREGAPKRLEGVTLVAAAESDRGAVRAAVARGSVLADVVCKVRDMVNAPANELTPQEMANRAAAAAAKHGFRAEILERRDLQRLGMRGMLAVSQGSEQPPRFIILEHDGGDRKAAPYLLVGKGLTFDAGGLCIKPPTKMDEMKGDMAGGAAVIGVIEAAARLGVPARVVGLVPAAENMLGGGAYRPGDILRMLNGKTVHIDNTDAEGRLVLADALTYGQRYDPRAIVDLATLTGAALVALGQVATAVLGNDRTLVRKLTDAGDRCFERLWELPMWEEFAELLKSPIADIKNTGGKNGATITAAAFLQHFVGTKPWAHLDIAGTAYLDKPEGYRPQGATGVGVRLMIEFLQAEVGSAARQPASTAAARARRGRR